MSIRLTEQYQTIALKSGNTMYRIYNMDIVSRTVDPQQPQQLNQAIDEKNSNRCDYRLLSFFDPSQYFFDTFGDQLLSQPNQNLSKFVKIVGNTDQSANAQSKLSSKKKNQKQYSKLSQNIHKSQDSQGDTSNQSDQSAISINKKISKVNQKFINRQKNQSKSNEFQNFTIYNTQLNPFKGFYAPFAESSISNGTTTHIFNNGDARLYEPSKQILKNQFQENENASYEQYKKLSISTSSQTNCQNLKNEKSQQNMTKREEGEESEEISIQVDYEENGQSTGNNSNKLELMKKGKNVENNMNIETFYNNQLQNNSNIKIEHQVQKNIQNSSNFPSQQLQSLQLWQIEQDRKLFLSNQQLTNRDFQNSFSQGQFQNQFIKIPIHRDGSFNESELGQGCMINNHLKIVNSAPSMLVHQMNVQNNQLMQNNINNNSNSNSINENNNVHNSELFKQLSLEYKMIPKNNTLKNIKKAFIRYLLKTSRKQLIKKCEQFNLEVGYILTNICQEIKYDHRHNKNIRFLLKSELISPLFKDFLENSEDYWFSNSSLLNPGPCRQMVQLLIKLSQNDSLVDVIQEYEK